VVCTGCKPNNVQCSTGEWTSGIRCYEPGDRSTTFAPLISLPVTDLILAVQ